MFMAWKQNLTSYFYVACIAAFSLFLVLGYIAFKNASDIANETHQKDMVALVNNEISRQVEFMARDQSQISNWDDTLTAINGEIDNGFIRREIAGWLWADFDIHDTVVVSPSGDAIATVRKSKVLETQLGQTLIDQNRELIEATTTLYFKHRKRTRSGYSFDLDPTRAGSIIYAHAFKAIDDQVSLFMAQAIVPSDGFTLADGNPHVLLTRKILSKAIFAGISEKLGLSQFRIVDREAANKLAFNTNIEKSDNLAAVWSASQPSTQIWQASKFLIGSIIALLGGILFAFAIFYGRALNRLQESDRRHALLALHDPLTKLPNRTKLEDALEDLIYNNMQETAAIMCMDIDNFKLVNDTLGHQTGDEVLKIIADRALAVVGDDGMIARTGGDEFQIVINGSPVGSKLLQLCDRITSAIAQPIELKHHNLRVAASIGVSRWSQRAMSVSQIMKQADEAMYRSKRNQIERTEIFDTKTQQHKFDNDAVIPKNSEKTQSVAA